MAWYHSPSAMADPSSSSSAPWSPEEISVFAAVYQADRQGAAGLMSQALALLGAGLAYIGIAAGMLNGEKIPGDAGVIAWLGLPAMMVAAFHVILVSLVFARGVSLTKLEGELLGTLGSAPDAIKPAQVGHVIGTRVSDFGNLWTRKRWGLGVQTLVAHGGTFAVIVAFTVYCLVSAAAISGWLSLAVTPALVFYCVCVAATVRSWFYVLMQLRDDLTASTK